MVRQTPWHRPVSIAAAAIALLALGPSPGRAATVTVGPGKTYAKPCAAIAAAMDGDLIEIHQ